MGQQQKRMRQKGLGRRTREEIYIYIKKCDQTDNPHIPDRGETSEIPGLPSGRFKYHSSVFSSAVTTTSLAGGFYQLINTAVHKADFAPIKFPIDFCQREDRGEKLLPMLMIPRSGQSVEFRQFPPEGK